MKDELVELLKVAGLKKIKRRGGTVLALCPNHNDTKLGSFVINEDKGIMKCFSCGYFSYISDFLIENGVSSSDALKYLISDKERSERKKVTEYYLGRLIPKSLLDRGFTIDTLRHFGVGYDEENRVTTIPLYEDGELIGIAYRKYPKYFSYSDGFEKRDFIYNFKNNKEGIFTEGFTDTWRTFQNGYEYVFATLGTAVTKEQFNKMLKIDKIILGYDLDFAGLKTAYTVWNKLKDDKDIYILPIVPDLGKKPDLGNCSKEAFNRAYKDMIRFVDFWSRLIVRNRSLTNLIEKQCQK